MVDNNGRIGIGTSTPRAKLEIQSGAGSDGAGTNHSAAFSYNTGGYRHWIRTRHNGSGPFGNAFDFFVNSSDSAEGSANPGVGNVHALTLDGGKVGIGSLNPGKKLQIGDYFPESEAMIRLVSISTNAGAVKTWDIGVPRSTTSLQDGNYSFVIDDIGWGTTPEFVVRWNSGNVGIGSVNPVKKLQIGDAVPNSEGMIRLVSTSSNVGAIKIWDIGVPRSDTSVHDGNYSFVIDDNGYGTGPEFVVRWNSGNVGIGNPNPDYKLDVNGDIHGSGGLRMDGGIVLGNGPAARDISATGRLHINAGENLHLNPFGSGEVVVGGGPGGSGRLRVTGSLLATVLELTSDRNVKQDFQSVRAREIAAKVAALPVSTWAYTNSPSVRHLGPMAQDFKAAFGLGEDDKHIGAGDGIGVALAAIKGLHEMVQEKDSEIAALKRELAGMKQELASVKESVADRLAALEIQAKAEGRRQNAEVIRSAPTHVSGYIEASLNPEAAR